MTEAVESDPAKTTWASHNPQMHSLPIREQPLTHGSAVAGSRALLQKANEDQREEYSQKLHETKGWLQQDIKDLAAAFHRDKSQVQFDLAGGTLYCKSRRLCFEDVKISLEAKNHNAGASLSLPV